MTEHKPTLIPRRAFLRGATVLAAATALGFDARAEAVASPPARTDSAGNAPPATTLAFWNGSRFVLAHRLTGPAFSGDTARLTIHGHHTPTQSGPGKLHGITLHHAVAMDGAVKDVPFHAWTATWQTPTRAVVTVPLTPRAGLLFSTTLRGGPVTEDCHFLAAGQVVGHSLLRAGTYLIAPGSPTMRRCRLTEQDGQMTVVRETLSGTVPANFEYVLMTVQAA